MSGISVTAILGVCLTPTYVGWAIEQSVLCRVGGARTMHTVRTGSFAHPMMVVLEAPVAG